VYTQLSPCFVIDIEPSLPKVPAFVRTLAFLGTNVPFIFTCLALGAFMLNVTELSSLIVGDVVLL
jgi:hypothetical protein